MELLCLADDLTGALEVGGILARLGVLCVVTTESAPNVGDGRALVVDTESRHLPPAEAAARVERLVRNVGDCCVFKKTDSTLRGNIGAELAAALRASPAGRLAYLPAYPAQGRTCRDGCLLVDGRPTGNAREVIAAQSDVTVHPAADADELRRLLAGPGGVIVCDGETDDDVRACVDVLEGTGALALTAGPAGIVEHLAPRLFPVRTSPPALPRAGTSLTVVGSRQTRSREQMRVAAGQGFAVVDGNVDEALAEHPHVVVATPSIDSGSSDEVRNSVAEMAVGVLQRCRPDALLVFGGDTLHGIAEACGVDTFRPVGEVMPGVPISRWAPGGRDMLLVSKAGGFGPPDVLARIRDRLSGN